MSPTRPEPVGPCPVRRALVVLALLVAACARESRPLTVYSGRSEELVGPILAQFERDSGVKLEVRYGDTAELAATILEEGDRSPADVFFAQDAGALGAVDGRLARLPSRVLEAVDARYRSPSGRWVGTSARARTLVYNTTKLMPADLPASVLDLVDARWRGRVGWAPTNGSFQAFVTALRVLQGNDTALAWLRSMRANGTMSYANNAAIVNAVSAGEIDAGLVNHYYVLELMEQTPDLKAANHFFAAGDPGALVNVAGVGVLRSSKSSANAEQLAAFLVSAAAQRHFAAEEYEYPVVEGVAADTRLRPLSELRGPDLDLSKLADLQGTLELLRTAGVL